MRGRLRFAVSLTLFLVVLGVAAVQSGWQRSYLTYSESLDQTAVTVDGVSLTLRDLAFYVAYEEGVVEAQAKIYDADDTSAYWKLRIGGEFVQMQAKEAAMEMAVHDEIFYRMAVSEGIALDEKEQTYLANSQEDFWNDLEEEQRSALGVTEEELNAVMERAALAQKYETIYTGICGEEDGAYAVDGAAYEALREEHEIDVQDDVWGKIYFGEITTSHTK